MGGLGGGGVWNQSHLFGRFDIDYAVTGELQYHAPTDGGGFPLMVFSPDLLTFSFSFGVMPMNSFFRPFGGIRLQGGLYSMDIWEVESNSEYLSTYDLIPYYLVSTETTDEGDPVRPKLQLGTLGIGPTVGGLIYFPGENYLLGAEVLYSYLFQTGGQSSQLDISLVFGNQF